VQYPVPPWLSFVAQEGIRDRVKETLLRDLWTVDSHPPSKLCRWSHHSQRGHSCARQARAQGGEQTFASTVMFQQTVSSELTGRGSREIRHKTNHPKLEYATLRRFNLGGNAVYHDLKRTASTRQLWIARSSSSFLNAFISSNSGLTRLARSMIFSSDCSSLTRISPPSSTRVNSITMSAASVKI